MEKNIKDFLINLLEEAGQTDFPPEVYEQLLTDLNERLEQKLILTAVSHLNAEKQAELEAMAEKKATEEEIVAFIRANLPNSEEVFKKAFEEFRKIYLGL